MWLEFSRSRIADALALHAFFETVNDAVFISGFVTLHLQYILTVNNADSKDVQ
jgi:hypothetical protein